MSNIRSAIENDIARVLLILQDEGVDIIKPNAIAAEVEKKYGEVDNKHQYLSVMKLRDMVRRYLSQKLDPVEKANEYIDGSGDLFDGVLQEHYPAQRDNERVYVRREEMTEDDIDRVIKRMIKASDGLLSHVDALQSWRISRAA